MFSTMVSRHNFEKPLISIVTLNYNRSDVTHAFLASTRALTYPNYEIIVWDNGSTPNPVADLSAPAYPYTHIIRCEENLGFAAGNNRAMELAQGEFIFIVNNDTEVTPTLLDHLLEPMLANPAIGAVSPKIRYYDAPDTIQYAGYGPMNLYTGRAFAVGTFERDQGQYDIPGYTHFAHGAAMLVRRDVLEKVGGFPEQFVFYYEELDLSARIMKAGFQIYYAPEALIFHKESVTMGRESTMKAYYMTRNRVMYIRRNASAVQQCIFIFYMLLMVIPRSIFTYLFQGKWAHLKAFIRGLVWHLRHPASAVRQESFVFG
jgi:GT2 family glycosyltransferase